MRANWLWPLLLVVIAALFFLQAFGVLPPAVSDLAGRAWPLALIILGVSVLIGSRIRYANFVVLGLSAVLMAAIIASAYNKQASQLRSDYHQSITQALAADVTSIRINATMLLAEITIEPADTRTVSADFAGSTQSIVTATYSAAQGVGTLTLSETRPGSIPLLEAIGHGKLTLRLPINIPIDELAIKSGEGALTLDATGTILRDLNVALQTGDITLMLPVLPAQSALGGSLHTSGGNLAITVPQGLTVKLTIDNGKPAFSASDYLLLSGGVLQSAGTRDFQVVLSAGASGTVALKP